VISVSKISVLVRLYASLRQYAPAAPEQGLQLRLEAGSTLADVCVQLEIPVGEVKLLFVNGRRQPLDYVLKDGDGVGMLPPLAGGDAS
jgi:sulfur-carrier protein